LARQPGLLGGGGGGGGELGGHPRLHVVGRHARGGHGGLEVALFRRADKLKKKGKKKVAFFVRGRLGPAAAAAAKTYVFIKDGGGGALEEVPETIAEPPPSFLALAVGAFFEPGELSTRKLDGTALQEPAELSVVRVKGEGGPAPATGDGRGRQNQETATRNRLFLIFVAASRGGLSSFLAF